MSLTSQVAKRRTFAIISHPDAGKTTITATPALLGGHPGSRDGQGQGEAV